MYAESHHTRSLAFALVALAALAAAPGAAADELTFAGLAGWWHSPLEHNGQRSQMYLHFVEEQGQQQVRLSLPDIGGWDIPFGAVTVSGNQVGFGGVTLTFDPAPGTLSGVAPEALVPVYRIPLSFRNVAAPAIPVESEWHFVRPGMEWTYDARAPVWAGIGYDEHDNLLFVGTDKGTIHALDARTGTPLWSVDTSDRIRAQPVAADGMVYVSSDDGYVYAYDARRGTERWRVKIDSSTVPRKPRGTPAARFDRYGSAPALAPERVYVGSRDGNLYALDRDSGAEIWRARAGDMITATPLLHDDLVLFGAYDGKLHAVSAADGKPRWQHDARGAIATDFAVANGRVVIGTRAYDLRALDVRDGRPLWNYYYWFSWIDSGPTVDDGVVYVGSSDAGSLFALDAANGKLRWRSPFNGWCWPRPAVRGRRVYAGMVGGDAGFTIRRGAFVALNRKTGAVIWAYESKPPQPMQQYGFAASPVATRHLVYAADLQGVVYAFKAR